MESKQLYVTKSGGSNSNVKVRAVVPDYESYDESCDAFREGTVKSNSSQVNEEVEKITGGDDETKQLFTIIRAEIKTNGNGLTIPLPRPVLGERDLKWVENKKNRGTNHAIVLCRASNGHA